MLLEKIYKVTAINKKSASEAFKNLKVGDYVHFSIPISAVGSGRHGSYAAYIKCKNLQNDTTSELSFNQIGKTLECFKWEESEIQDEKKLKDLLEYKDKVFLLDLLGI